MSVTIRQEINIIDAVITGATDDTAKVQLDTTQYVSPTYYFEAVGTLASGTEAITLRREGTTTDDATVTFNAAANTRYRSASFSPPAGQTTYMVHCASTNANVRAARIIIIDSPSSLTSSQTQIEIGNQETGKTNTAAAALTNPKYWTYTAANWDGTKTFYAECTYAMSSTKVSGTITLQEDAAGTFSTWSDKVTIVSAGTASTPTRVRSIAFTPTAGRNYRIATLNSSSKSTLSIYNAKIIVDQSDSPTLLEPQYLLLNKADGGTGLQGYQQQWNSSEWSGVTNLYAYSHDSDNLSNSSKLQDIDNGNSDIATATVTGVHQKVQEAVDTYYFDGSDAGATDPNSVWTNDANGFDGSTSTYANTGSTGSESSNYLMGEGTNSPTSGNTILSVSTRVYAASNVTPAAYGASQILTTHPGGWDWQKVNDLEVKIYASSGPNDFVNSRAYPNGSGTSLGGGVLAVDASSSDYRIYKTEVLVTSRSGFTMPTSGHQFDVNVTDSTGIVTASRVLVIVSVDASGAATSPGWPGFF